MPSPLALLPPARREDDVLDELRRFAGQNKILRTLIGMGYYDCFTPGVILRNVLENPGWYTAYTPYQPEISQGRLEALLNFQTMVMGLTGMEMANASLLDEATAAAEAMTLCRRVGKKKSNTFFVSDKCHPQTIDVLRTRAEPLGITLIVGDVRKDLAGAEPFGLLLQYPASDGAVEDYADIVASAHENFVVVLRGATTSHRLDCHLPWHGCASPAEVPYKVTKSTTRPRSQLKRAENMGWLWVRALIEKCWLHEPGHRPSFTEIVSELEDTQATIAANLIGGLE